MSVYTHRGLGTPTSQDNIFYSEKLSPIFLVLLAGFKPWVFGSRVRRSTNWATPSPMTTQQSKSPSMASPRKKSPAKAFPWTKQRASHLVFWAPSHHRWWISSAVQTGSLGKKPGKSFCNNETQDLSRVVCCVCVCGKLPLSHFLSLHISNLIHYHQATRYFSNILFQGTGQLVHCNHQPLTWKSAEQSATIQLIHTIYNYYDEGSHAWMRTHTL